MTAFLIHNMAPMMFATLIVVLLIGYPVAFSLAAIGLIYGFLGIELGLFRPDFLQALPERIYGVMNNDTLLAIPFFTFMGLILERSGMRPRMTAMRFISSEIPWRNSSTKQAGTRNFAGHCASPPAFDDCSLMLKEAKKNGQPVMIITIVKGRRKNTCPKMSIELRTAFGSRLFTMSMRMCSLFNSVHGEHRRKTTENRIHCSSSHLFELVSNTLRTIALPAETNVAARIAHASHLPIRVLIASIARLSASNACIHPPCAAPARPRFPSGAFSWNYGRLNASQT